MTWATAQLLCDRILLIDQGARLLYGTVAEVRAAFSDGAVAVSGRNIPADPAAYRSVEHITARDGSMRFLLRDGNRARPVPELAATDAVVERFTEEAPDLAEIFIRAVAGDARAEAVR